MDDNQGLTYNSARDTIENAPSSLTSVIIRSFVKYIGKSSSSQSSYAFYSCSTTLQSISFDPNPELIEIRSYAFFNIINLASIDLSVCTKLLSIGVKSFYNCYNLVEIILPDSLVSLGEDSLAYMKITSISFPASLTTLPAKLLEYCRQLKTIIIPLNSEITFVGASFLRVTQITSFMIPSKVNSIQHSAFAESNIEEITVHSDNKNFLLENKGILTNGGRHYVVYPPALTGVAVIPHGVTYIYTNAFASAHISSVEISDTVTNIGSYCFSGSSLETIVIPDTVTNIGNSAFQFCSRLSSVKLSKNIKTLESNLFDSCNFSSIEIPSGVTTIKTNCFVNCKNMKDIRLPESLTSLEGAAFPPGTKIITNSNFIIDENTMMMYNTNRSMLSGYLGTTSNAILSIPSTVVEIKAGAFQDKANVKSISFPSDSKLTTIGRNAFANCRSMSITNFPSTVVSIGDHAFENCLQISSMNLQGLEYLGNYSFSGCINLETFSIESTKITRIGEDTFKGCSKLSLFVIPSQVMSIGKNAFQNCIMLSSITFTSSIADILSNAFDGCGLQTVDMSMCNQLQSIPDYCFSNNIKLSSFNFPENIYYIGVGAFMNTSLKNLVLPSQVNETGRNSFMNCKQLSSFVIQEHSRLVSIGIGTFRNCLSIKTIETRNPNFKVVTGALFDSELRYLILFPPASDITYFSLPGTTNFINDGAFLSCVNLVSIFIPSGSVQRINDNAFEGCVNLAWINIPKSVKYIGVDAFLNCPSLRCGVRVENNSKEFIDSILSKSKISKSSLRECKVEATCKEMLVYLIRANIHPCIVLYVAALI